MIPNSIFSVATGFAPVDQGTIHLFITTGLGSCDHGEINSPQYF
jgi:hypothetical protein